MDLRARRVKTEEYACCTLCKQKPMHSLAKRHVTVAMVISNIGQPELAQRAAEQHKETGGDMFERSELRRPAVLATSGERQGTCDRRMSLATCEQSSCRLTTTDAPFFAPFFEKRGNKENSKNKEYLAGHRGVKRKRSMPCFTHIVFLLLFIPPPCKNKENIKKR